MLYNPLNDIPDISFVPTSTEELLEEMTADYEKYYKETTGENIKVQPASEVRIFLYTQAYRYYLMYMMIDNGLKMNLLKYSRGAFLENLGAWFGITRNSGKPSYTTVKFTLSAPRQVSTTIPAGTRVSTGDNIFFKTLGQLIIPSGEITGEVNAVSITAGKATNGIPAGDINIIVDPIPFVAEAKNETKSQGGADVEDDDSLRTRIFYYPDRFSTAGPENAYIYFAKTFSQSIESIKVFSPEPGHVDIRVALEDGELPEQAFLDELYAYLDDKDKRPLTDFLYVGAAEKAVYSIDFKYYIASSNYEKVKDIQDNVKRSVEEFVRWQNSEIGRDVTPDVLIKLLVEAGVKRVEINEPHFTVIPGTCLAVLESAPLIDFGGMEND